MEKHLTRRTLLNELAEMWCADTFTGLAAQNWAALRSEFEKCLADGGELWEWESEGVMSFQGEYGIAVVLEGEWVLEKQIGRS